MSEKIYRVQMNSKGMPNFSTAVEIADRPQGEWIKKEYNGIRYYECEKCRGEVPTNAYYYCPWCRTRMKGADDE